MPTRRRTKCRRPAAERDQLARRRADADGVDRTPVLRRRLRRGEGVALQVLAVGEQDQDFWFSARCASAARATSIAAADVGAAARNDWVSSASSVSLEGVVIERSAGTAGRRRRRRPPARPDRRGTASTRSSMASLARVEPVRLHVRRQHALRRVDAKRRSSPAARWSPPAMTPCGRASATKPPARPSAKHARLITAAAATATRQRRSLSPRAGRGQRAARCVDRRSRRTRAARAPADQHRASEPERMQRSAVECTGHRDPSASASAARTDLSRQEQQPRARPGEALLVGARSCLSVRVVFSSGRCRRRSGSSEVVSVAR